MLQNLLQAAKREVWEETGLIIGGLHSISFGPNLLDPSKSDEDFGVAVGYVTDLFMSGHSVYALLAYKLTEY